MVTILNTTPGKKSYHLIYPTDEDIATWKEEAKDASNIIYRYDPESGLWEGIVVSISFPGTDCPTYGYSLLDKLCSDLYYMRELDTPEAFIGVIKSFTLPDGVTPSDYARTGVDPMAQLGLVE